MTAATDLSRLRAALDGPELARVLDALQRRVELGRPLTGTLSLSAATAAERAAIDAIFGRKSTRGQTLSIDLDWLGLTLREAGIATDLAAAVKALRGDIVDRRSTARARASAWAATWREADAAFAAWPALRTWIGTLARLGTMRRLAGGDAGFATALLRDLARVAAALPAAAEPLPAFAARLFGDAHALDPGQPRATLAVRAAAKLGAVPFENDAEGRRAAWGSVGIMSDELSTPVLVLNLPATGETPLHALLRAGCAHGEPAHVSLRALLRYPISRDPAFTGRRIFVCENPTIVALAAERFGRACAPLVCVNGQFATPSLILLRQLREAGARLYYHGDFDPAGVAIARRAMAESGGQPWRFAAADYLAAPKGERFRGRVGATPWDPALAVAMHADGRAAHEEAVFASIADDLAGGGMTAP